MKDLIEKAIAFFPTETDFFNALGVCRTTVWLWKKGKSVPSPEKCVLIERVTHGVVSRRQLRPDDYGAIWPELLKNSRKKRAINHAK